MSASPTVKRTRFEDEQPSGSGLARGSDPGRTPTVGEAEVVDLAVTETSGSDLGNEAGEPNSEADEPGGSDPGDATEASEGETTERRAQPRPQTVLDEVLACLDAPNLKLY